MNTRLFLFNPENDLALAHGGDHYLPPAPARCMASDLAVLPAWLGHAGAVLVPSIAVAEAWQDTLPVDLPVEWASWREEHPAYTDICPWGWNRTLAKQLRAWGVDPASIPTEAQLERMRALSSRLLAVDVLAALQADGRVCGCSTACASIPAIEAALRVPSGHYGVAEEKKFLKAPWSGSGKGLRWGTSLADGALLNWCRRTLEAQGHVVVEPIYNKVYDFAMEFRADGKGRVDFVGYSLFRTDANGAYKENLLLTDKRIADILSAKVGPAVLDAVQLRLQAELSARLGTDYRGFLGVDMMVVAFDREPYYCLHPCVEVNLRMNMGVVSRRIADRWLAPGSEGVFRIDCFKRPEELAANHAARQQAFPLQVEQGRIRSGYLSLAPVGKTTVYRASVEVRPPSIG